MNDDTTRQDALQMSRDLISMVDQEQQQAEHPHTDLGDCIGIVAYSVWNAAWRRARGDQAPDPELLAQITHLVDHDDFLTLALYRHNWRNVNEVLAAFRDAGLAGTADVARFYTHVDHIPKASEGPRPERQLPEWCGEWDGPEPGRRMVDVPVPPGEPRLVKWCPRCEPRSPEYQTT